MRVTGSDKQQYYIPEGALLLRPGRRDVLKACHDPKDTLVKRRENKVKNLEEEITRLKSQLKLQKISLDRANQEHKGCQGELQKWENLYNAQKILANEHEENYESQYNLRVSIENEADRKVKEMAARVFELGSENEEIRVTEDEVLN